MKDADILTPEMLLHGYAVGIFPMAESRDDPDLFWVDPRRRGVFPLDGFRISRSLARAIRRMDYRVTLNHDFAGVVDACADRDQTWINAEIARLYLDLHDMGHAHSIEVWRDEALIGGVYGVTFGSAFFGESMFSRATNGSKIALAWLVHHLAETGFTLFDTQFITAHLASLGAVEIPRARYHAQLREAIRGHAEFASRPLPRDVQSVLQRSTQMS